MCFFFPFIYICIFFCNVFMCIAQVHKRQAYKVCFPVHTSIHREREGVKIGCNGGRLNKQTATRLTRYSLVMRDDTHRGLNEPDLCSRSWYSDHINCIKFQQLDFYTCIVLVLKGVVNQIIFLKYSVSHINYGIHPILTSPSYNPEQLAPTAWAEPFCKFYVTLAVDSEL